jgi:predicted Rossmann-fold nucleotide-binding protein
MPGGFGTQDEFFETLTLVQTKIIKNFPIVVIGKEYHEPLIDWMEHMIAAGTISAQDRDCILLTDDCDEAIEHIRKYVSSYGVTPKKRFWWLFEKA